ncbi:MAG: metallophosphoesterase [Candidatus Pacearchaeota archaeon]|nr:metallophosphoesterase [Candidatus Pacearchaeota archaeon]
MNKEILNAIREKGILLEKEIFDVISGMADENLALDLLEQLMKVSGQKMITKASLNKNFEFAKQCVQELPGGVKTSIEKVFIKLGLNLEIEKKTIELTKTNLESEKDGVGDVKNSSGDNVREPQKMKYKIFYADTTNEKKITVQDFVGHFRARYRELQGILINRQGMENLTSINKISGNRQNLTFIGMVREKRVTKNRNLIVVFEDLTGQINALIKADNENFKAVQELQLDDVVAVKCSGNNEIVFIQDVIYPDSFVLQKTKFDEEICIAFISDIHVGSGNFLGKEFENFIYWLNGNNELAKKIKYIFVVGDAVDGVGVFPGQERLLKIKTLKGQYDAFAEYIRKIPEEVTLFMCPGQHDASRVLEPQPILDKTYAGALYEIPNFVMVSNPCMVKLLEKDKEFKVLMYHGASIHPLINNIEELRIMKAQKTPAKAVKHMLKRRHLAPMHGVSHSIVYVPNIEKDPMVISEVPDILCTGEVHRLDVERYNGTLILTGSCWQSQTDFEVKVGNIPDPCKVPVFNLKTHELKILDFSLGDSVFGGKDEN